MSDYLWDKSGTPDPEVVDLESLLSEFRYAGRALSPPEHDGLRARPTFRWRIAAASIAALLAIAFVIGSRFVWRNNAPWQVTPVAGSPRIAGAPVARATSLSVGEVLETDASSRARLRIASIGALDVEPGSRLRLLTTRTRHHRIALDYGTVSAHLWAPPFSFGVQTPSSLALDLGCAFTLHVDRDGYGVLRVTSGWVELQRDDVQSIIPAGAEAVTRPELGPGTVHFIDASPELIQALNDFDTKHDLGTIDTIVAAARPRDAITLLSLLRKVPLPRRRQVLDRLTQCVPIPDGFTRDDVLELQTRALDAYWRNLGLGDSKSWILNWKDALHD